MKNFLKDIIFASFIIIIFALGRFALLHIFGQHVDVPSCNWYLMSFRFDLMTAAYILLPTAIFTFISFFINKKFATFKVLYSSIVISLCAAMAIINICYFKEYGNQFDQWIFGLFLDDLYPILNVIWNEYPIVLISISLVIFYLLIYKFFKFLYSKIDSLKLPIFKSKILAFISFSLYLFVIIICMRGGTIDGRPLQFRDTSVEPSVFLNNIIPSSAFCLKYQISSFISSRTGRGLEKFEVEESQIDSIAKDVFGKPNLNEALARSANGSPIKIKPKRIFFILGEGHSVWPTYDKFSKYELMECTKAIYERSLFCKTALPSGGGTMASVSSFVSGIPFYGLDIAGIIENSTDCSIAKILSRLGYLSTFYYAGQSNWMGLREFLIYNGFSQVIGGEQMGEKYNSVEWGMRDKDMFDFILKEDIPENSFNMILTVSNHPPYDIDLKAEGCTKDINSENERRLYHLWYADKQIGRFEKAILEKYPDSIVIISGDHTSRIYPESETMSEAEKIYVPVIISGKPIEDFKKQVLDCQQLDIIPTIIEILAPKGFKYSAWGFDMFKLKRPQIALTYKNANYGGNFYVLNSSECSNEMRDLSIKYHALAYYKYHNGKDKKEK